MSNPESTIPAEELKDLRVLVTRPEHQSANLVTRLEHYGAVPIQLPLIRITPLALNPKALCEQIKDTTLLIFISTNAVDCWNKIADPDFKRCLSSAQPRIAAIGRKTVQQLQSIGYRNIISPTHGYTSENLLALPVMKEVKNQRIVILRGAGGREMLAQSLRDRGAHVAYLDLYARSTVQDAAKKLETHLRAQRIDVVMLTSVEILNRFVDILPGNKQQYLESMTLLAGSRRIANALQQLQLNLQIEVASDPTDAAMIQALRHWYRSKRQP